jgi:microcompartment protein CcmL/EutN
MGAQESRVQVMHHHVRQEVTDRRASFKGQLADDTQLHVSVVLQLRNQAALTNLLQRLYDPSSPDYRHFLTVEQFTDQFGPTEEDYAAVAGYLQSHGLKVESAPANRLIVPVSGSAAQVNAAFNVQMNTYQHPTEDRTFFSPDREPSLRLNVPVRHITGLDDFSRPRHFTHRPMAEQAAATVNGSGPGGSYLGSDMRAAYYGGTTLDGTGQAVGILEFGGYDMADVTLTFSNAGQTNNVPINNVLLDGATGGTQPPFGDGEQVLDIVQAIGMAPGLSQVRVYIGLGLDDANILNAMASENIAKQLSCSWGWRPADPATDDVFFQEMAAQGQSFFAASGDDGAFDSAISPFFYPGEDQYVTTVGGTHLTTSGPGGTWVSETVWNSGGGGSGGGISPDGITLPSYQSGLANSTNGGSTTLRNVPDVAMEGDFDNYNCAAHVCSGGWAGTSFAAPRWAAFMALVNQQAVEAGNAPAGGIGFLNPALYQLAQGANTSNDLHDVVSGNNRTANQPVWFSAVAGFDLTTGWGSANGQRLIDDLAGPQVPGFWLTSSQSRVDVNPGGTGTTTVRITDAGGFTGAVNLAVTSTLPSGVTASFASNPATASNVLTFSVDSSLTAQDIPVTVTGTAGSLTQTTTVTLSIHTPTFALVPSSNGISLNPGNTTTATITVVPQYGFTGSVNLAISGLPSGVTASFSPATTSGTSTLTLTASASATASTNMLTITGTSGSITATKTLPLTITAPKFALVSSSPVSVGQGSTASTYVYVLGQNGFSGNVTLTATNLPAGVTATFSTNPTTYTSNVTFTATSTAPAGQSTVTITGTSGALTASTSITLNVMTPTFTLSSSGSLTMGQGGSVSSYVNVVGQYGFTGNVAMSVSGLPAGVTALWGPNPTTSSTSLYLYATNSVTPGQYPLTITGTSGSLTQTTTLTLTVAAPTFTMFSGGTVTMGLGTSVYTYVDLQRQYGFSGSVTLSASGLPSGVTASFSPNPLTGTDYNSSLLLQASSSTVPGQYTVNFTGVSGNKTATASMPLVIVAPSFAVSGNSLTVGQGLSGTTYVYVNQLYGFSGAVNLSVSGLPSGVTASFSTNPTTAYSDQLTFNVGSTVPAGQYPLTITGTSGSLTQTSTLTLTVGVPSFTLSSYGLTVGQGQSSSTSVYVNDVNGFNGPVNLSVSGLPNGVTASFPTNPTTAYYNQLTFSVGSTVPAGQYPLTITGTSGSETETTTMTLTVGVPSYTLYAASSPTIGQGMTGTAYVYVQAQNGFNGNVNLAISGLPSGVTAVLSPTSTTYSSSILFTVSSTAAVGTSTLTITGTYGSLTQTTTMTLTVAAPTFTLYGPYSVSLNQGSSATSSVTVSPQYGFTGNVALSASGLPSGVTAAFSPNPATGTSTMTLSASSTAASGATTFTITGTSGSITNSMQAQVLVNASSFSLTAAPGEVFMAPGASGKSTINILPVNGFASGVSLSASGLPAGVTASFSPATATKSSTLTLTANSTAVPGRSTVIVTGNSGAETSSTALLLTITNGAGTATSTTLAFSAGGSAVTTVTQGILVAATASVHAGSNPVTAGQVYLCDASAAYCDSVHQIATAQLTSSGNAVFRFVPGSGARTYKAVFAGTTANTSSSSGPASLTVTASLPTTTTLTQSGTAGNYSLTASVTGQGPMAPSGDVSFIDTNSSNSVLASAATVLNSTATTENVAQTIPTGTYPAYMVSGDFNGDGIPDLAVANTGSSTVSILLGSSSGTFSAGTALQIGSAPGSIAVGDFNRDGNLDLAVVVPSTSTVAIFFGNSDGTFTASTTTVYTPPQPSGIVAADLNGDGFVDLAVPSQTSGSVTILLGHGDGTFTPANFSAATGSSPQSIVQADFNGDGVPDLAITNYYYTGSVMILLGNGDGTFTAAPALSMTAYPYSVAVGDFNHDGRPDLAVGANGGTGVNLFLGNGDGTFTAAANPLTTGYVLSLAVADINGDGQPDLIAADASSYKLTTLLGHGDGTFTTGVTQTINSPEGVVVGDWNSDGVPDIAVVNYYSSSVTTVTTQLAWKVTAIANNVSPNGTGQHTVKAMYPGDISYAGSTSGTVIEVGNKATPEVALALSSPSISYTAPLTVSVQVTDSTNNGVPTGVITLTSGSYTSAAITLTSGRATITVPAGTLAVGTDTLTVNYTPDASGASLYNAASATGSVSVDRVAPTITWPIPAAITYGTALSGIQLNATSSTNGTFSYTPAVGTVLHAGWRQLSVTFTPTDTAHYQSSTSSIMLSVNKASLNISANSNLNLYGLPNPVFWGAVTGAVNGDTFTETFSTSATISSPPGTYPIVPSVSGANLADYTVAATNGALTISPAPTATSFALSNQNLSLTATVTSWGSGTPTGPVTFYAGQTQLGTGTLSGGTASITLTSFPSGNVSLSAQYAGDGNFAPSTSASTQVLTVTAASTSLNVTTAGTVTDNFSLAVPSGYTGAVQFSCMGLPQDTSCSFQPASITFAGTRTTATATTVLTLTTGAQARMDSAPIRNTEADAVRWAAVFALPGLLPLLFKRRQLRARLRMMALLLLISGTGMWFTGCAGSGGGSKPSTSVTPSGSYTIQVVASAPSGVSQSTAVSVTVQ